MDAQQFNQLQNNYYNGTTYEDKKAKRRAYNQTTAAAESRRLYAASAKGRAARKRYQQSDKGKQARARWAQSQLGKEAKKRYAQSDRGREMNRIHKQRYNEKKKEQAADFKDLFEAIKADVKRRNKLKKQKQDEESEEEYWSAKSPVLNSDDE